MFGGMVQWHSPYDLTALPQNTKSMKQKLAEQKIRAEHDSWYEMWHEMWGWCEGGLQSSLYLCSTCGHTKAA